jgi:DNA-binding transcriptional LysR family regulator
LEEEMGVELFDRTSYRPALTEHGKLLLEKSLVILQSMTDLEHLGESFKKNEEPEIGISIDGIGLTKDLLKLLKTFAELHPNTKLNMSFDILSEAERRVIGEETEMGITHFVTNQNLLDVVPIASISMVPVMNRDLFKEKKVKSQNDLKLIDQIVIGDKNPSGASFGLLDDGKKWRILDTNFKREIIFSGLGWGHMPMRDIERELKEKKLVILEFEDIHPRELAINLIRSKKHHFGPVAKRLWDELISFHL